LCSSLIIGQGAVGWWMVKSGLNDKENENKSKDASHDYNDTK